MQNEHIHTVHLPEDADVVTGVEADGGAGGPDSVDATLEPPSA